MINVDHLYPWNRENFERNNIDHFSDRKLSYTVVENGYIMSAIGRPTADGGVFDSNRCHVDGTSLHTGILKGKSIGLTKDSVSIDEGSIEFSDETVIYIGLMYVGIWGHDITDELSRLWFLESTFYKKQFKGCKVFCAPMREKPHDNFLELLEIMGVDHRIIQPVMGVKKYRRIIIPDQSYFRETDGSQYFTEEYRRMIDRVRQYGREHMRPELPKKLYFTYEKFIKKIGIRSSEGEERLEKFFAKQGYTVIAPEDYSFKEQLALLTSCVSFASTIGSCAHNSMFLPDGAQVILIPRADYFTGYQETINFLWPQNIFYVDCQLSVLTNVSEPWGGPFCYHVSDELIDFFSCPLKNSRRVLRESRKDLISYLRANQNMREGTFGSNVGTYYRALDLLARHESQSLEQLLRDLRNKGLRCFLREKYMSLPDWMKAPYRFVKKRLKH